MGDEVKTIVLKGEGGMLIHHDLPLPEHIADRLSKGYLTRVNEDGTNWDAEDDDDGVDPAQGVVSTVMPDPKDLKTAWVGWAVLRGATPDEAEGMTKADLIDKYGKK